MKIEIERPHGLSIDAVKSGLNREIDIAKEKFGHHTSSVEYGWTNEILAAQLNAFGAECNSKTTVYADRVTVEVIVPLVLTPFKHKINEMVMFRLNRVCNPVKR